MESSTCRIAVGRLRSGGHARSAYGDGRTLACSTHGDLRSPDGDECPHSDRCASDGDG